MAQYLTGQKWLNIYRGKMAQYVKGQKDSIFKGAKWLNILVSKMSQYLIGKMAQH